MLQDVNCSVIPTGMLQDVTEVLYQQVCYKDVTEV